VCPEVGSRPLSLSKGAFGSVEVEELVRPVVEAAGLELVEVTFGRQAPRRVLRVIVDRQGGVDLDAISDVSERVSRRLDLEGFAPGPYSLEVSSPGIERALRQPSDFARRLGETVRVKTNTPLEGSRTIVGALVSADDESIVIATAGGEVRVPYRDIASARTVVDWDREMNRSSR
jgi:ribosome maturation factor RimP